MAKADCPICRGTGWKTVEKPGPSSGGVPARQAVLCDCTETDRAVRVMLRARIPRRYEHCDFENFDVDPYDSPESAAWHHSLGRAKIEVQGFARDYPASGDSGLLLMGPCGTGKTHLAVAALKEIVVRGHSGLFYDYRELLKEIQASYNPASQAAEMDVLEPVLTAEVLLLDDLGSSKPSTWALETVGHILNTRYNEKRVTLMTTNYLDGAVAPSSPAASPRDTFAEKRALRMPSGQPVSEFREEALAQRIGERIRSRLYEMCRTVEIVSADYRQIIRQAGRVRL